MSASTSKSLSKKSQHPKLHIRAGLRVTLQDNQCCWKLLHLVHGIIAFTDVIGIVPPTHFETQATNYVRTRHLAREAVRKTTQRTHTTLAMGDGRSVCEPHATTDMCFMQWWSSSSFVWRRRKGRGGGRERESDRDGGGGREGEGGESSQGSRSLQNLTPKKETRLTPCTRSPELCDANVEREPCRYS